MGVPAKVYELLAQQIIEDYKIVEGRCLDVGTGRGLMGLEIGKRSNLQLYLLDIDGAVLAEAEENCRQQLLADRATVIKAAVEELPFIDNYFELIVSRGSIFFWKDISLGFKEILRVLKPGRIAFVGGGTSRCMTKSEREDFFRWAGPRHRKYCKDWERIGSESYMRDRLAETGITSYQIHTGYGLWIEITK